MKCGVVEKEEATGRSQMKTMKEVWVGDSGQRDGGPILGAKMKSPSVGGKAKP